MIKGFSDVRRQGTSTLWYTFSGTTPRGETLIVELTKCSPDNSNPRSLPNLWYKAGYTASVLPSYWYVETYATDPRGRCYGLYNPTAKRTENGPCNRLNFDWVLTATDDNRRKILDEIARRANAHEV